MRQIELLNKRKPREKHFLQPDGTIIAKVYSTDIHYMKNGKYEDIDNTLIKENGHYRNKSNNYEVQFNESIIDSLFKMKKDDFYIDFKIKECKEFLIKLHNDKSKVERIITYENILENASIEYRTLPNKVKETIILHSKGLYKLNFSLDTNLNLEEYNGEIIARNCNDETIFIIEKPYMVDSNNIKNENINYILTKTSNKYELSVILDEFWLNSNNRKYPIYIDPTITVNNDDTLSLYDTYIYPGDGSDDRNSKSYLKAGVEMINEQIRPNRTLIKFDLPTIGTGSEIVYATLDLTSYPTSSTNPKEKLATIHRITSDWDETTANWENMNNNYDSRVESIFYGCRSTIVDNEIIPASSIYDNNITSLVKKWYRNEANYGLMIKAVDETKYEDDDYPIFYSKDNTLSEENNPKPVVSITYKNQNGIENYLNYREQKYADGSTYINTFNGNMTAVFEVGKTVGGKMPASVKWIYNNNDIVIYKNTIYGKGSMLNIDQNVKYLSENNSLEYCDEDGTIHYFYKRDNENNNLYYDEDGLSLIIEKINNLLTITDKKRSKLTFESTDGEIYLLNSIKDVYENTILIERDSNNNITKVIDSSGEIITFNYDTDKISIVSNSFSSELNYLDGKLVSIVTPNGTTQFVYNGVDLISEIIDVTGIKNKYRYYPERPYRIRKLTQYGIEDEEGQSLNLNYGFNTTTISNNELKPVTLIFNSNGNLISINNLGTSEDLNGAYSLSQTYGDGENINKITSASFPTRYVKNYIKNASFENDTINFTTDSESRLTIDYSEEVSYSGNRSLDVTCLSAGQCIEQRISVPKGKYYTFSAQFQTQEYLTLQLMYAETDGTVHNIEQEITPSFNFSKEYASIYYSENASTDLIIRISFGSVGHLYMDNVQLEEGEVSNEFNYIENSDFSDGVSDWSTSAWVFNDSDTIPTDFLEIVSFNNNKNKALKIKMNPWYGTSISKTFDIKGKAGELLNISFWYKNEGIPGYGPVVENNVEIYCKPVGTDAEYCIIPSDNFNPNEDIWQYFTFKYKAPEDYESVKITFRQGRQANNLYITNLSLNKALICEEYVYDGNGNVASMKNQNEEKSIFSYDTNNMLISAAVENGGSTKYEYDNIDVTKVISKISSTGIVDSIEYNEKGNPILVKTSKKMSKEIENNNYRIRCKGTQKHMKAELNCVLAESSKCSNTIWKFEKVDNKYKIRYAIRPEFLITVDENMNIILATNENLNCLFNLEKNENGSYKIGVSVNGNNKYFKSSNSEITLDTFVEDDSSFQFYIELVDELFFEKKTNYTSDGKYVESIVDNNLITSYSTNSNTGAIKSLTNANGKTTNYTYNEKQQMISTSLGDRVINYNYNSQNKLSNISVGNKEYNFEYDKFLNHKTSKIGDITLSTNTYEEKNGDLISTLFGNNQEVRYTSDEFSRLVTYYKMDDTYNFKYDNNGQLAQAISNNTIEKFAYDLGKRLNKYRNGIFSINYAYDLNNNLTGKTYDLNYGKYNTHTLVNTYDENELPVKTTVDNSNFEYSFDELGRVISLNINNLYFVNFEYIGYGKKATNTICKMTVNDDTYEYGYDNLQNILKITKNNAVQKEYEYNDYNELITEYNYEKDSITEYMYDNYGNIQNVVEKNITTNLTTKEDVYQYNNANWKDQLTNFNGTDITYDTIGNPTGIGNNITLSWINGRELSSYSDSDNNLSIQYKYNMDGIRTSKTVNGSKIDYYLESENIIYEKRDSQIIYYMYDMAGIIGMYYNNNYYYYIKNLQDDIIGIMNSQGEKIVSYEYDSWGKIVSIKDNEGIEITDSSNVGIINPFRYRSYYYDVETKLYYLNSRYYNPEWRRFINADAIICSNNDFVSFNLYTYVSNNPVVLTDVNGHGIILLAGGLLLTGALILGKKYNDSKSKSKKKSKKAKKSSVGTGVSFSTKPTGIVSVSGGIGVTTGKSSNKNVITDTSVNAGFNNNEFDVTPDISIGNYGIEFGDGSIEISKSYKVGKSTHKRTYGLDGDYVYTGFSSDIHLEGDEYLSMYGRYNVRKEIPMLILAAVAVYYAAPVVLPAGAAAYAKIKLVGGALKYILPALGTLAGA